MTQRLTIYLLQNIGTPEDALAEGKNPVKVAVTADLGARNSAFYFTSRPPVPPSWLAFVRQVAPEVPALSSSSASGLLVVEADGRHFALTFGYGRSLLDLSKIERQFGLKVALNRIDPAQLRSMDTKTFEDLVVTRTTQSSRSTDLPTFGVDVSSDILRAVTGEPRDTALSKKLSGADALVLSTSRDAADLPAILCDLLAAFSEGTYKENFAWVDHLGLVNDASLVAVLDAALAAQLADGDTHNTHMATPEVIGWEEIESFKVTGSKAIFDDLDLDDYLDALGPRRSQISVPVLKGRQVSVKFSRSGDFEGRWTLYNCLIAEQRVGDKLYVLIEGRWLAVSDSLAAEVDTFAASLPSSATALVESSMGEKEADYNRRLAGDPAGELLLLDAKIKIPGGASSGIELCDLLSSEGEFIHVKRKSRSSTLSHLFAQGTVSAATFLNDGGFRERFRQEIEDTVAPEHQGRWLDLIPGATSSVDRSRYTVSYAVIASSNKEGTDWLPFFSKLNLMQQGKQILSLGFQLSISKVTVGP
ncbi:DUF6119 family protein [Mycobacterium sp. NPDC049093]